MPAINNQAKEGMEEINEIIKKANIALDTEREQRRLAVRDLMFVDAEDGQWSEDAKEKRRNRPRYTIDKISGPIDQVVGNQQQNEIGVDVIPLRDATEEIAEIYDGLIRAIEQDSDAINTYDDSFNYMLKCGYGGWRIVMEWEDDDSMDQEIKIHPIESAASSLYFDPRSIKYTREDAQWAILVRDMLREDFKEEFPNAAEVDFDAEKFSYARSCHWVQTDTIRVAEWWEKVPVKKNLALLSDGRVIDTDEDGAALDELAAEGITVVRTRVVDSHKVMVSKINAAEILEGPTEWPGKYIPLIPEYGKVSIIEGRKYIRGMVRKAKDPQRIYNYATSQAIETTALSPKEPIMMTPTQYGKHSQQWKTFNTKNPPIALYDPDTNAPGVPQRLQAPQVQGALLQQVQQATEDIYSTTGIEPASLGIVPKVKSGTAIQNEDEKGDRGTFAYQKNHTRSIHYTGKQLVDLIPRVYDAERTTKIIGPDGAIADVTINQTVIDEQTGEPIIVNDLSQGKYGVVSRSGPASVTKKAKTVEQLTGLIEKAPQYMDLLADLVVKNMDLTEGKEATKRIRKQQITSGVVEPTEEEKKEYGLDQPPPPDPMQEELIANLRSQTEENQMKVEDMISKIENRDADTQKKILEGQNTAANSLKVIAEALKIKLVDLQIPLDDDDAQTAEGQQALVDETIEDVLEGQEIAGSLPMNAKGLAQGQIDPNAMGMPEGPSGPIGPQPGVDIPAGFEGVE
jgi:hypothetical protein